MMNRNFRRRGSALSIAVGVAAGLLLHAPSAPAQSLDFEFFKTRVAPIFLKQRGEHARCYACHQRTTGAAQQYLEKLPEGADFWTDEQLRIIFERVSRLVVPGDPSRSKFVMHPLAPEQGGWSENGLHSGGRKFADRNDPDWQTLAEWIRGATVEQ